MIREANASAAAVFVDTVAQIREPLWLQPGPGVWTVRDLVGHTSRALLTVETYLTHSAPHADLARPIDYYLQVRAQTQATLAAPAAVAARERYALLSQFLQEAGLTIVPFAEEHWRTAVEGLRAVREGTARGRPHLRRLPHERGRSAR